MKKRDNLLKVFSLHFLLLILIISMVSGADYTATATTATPAVTETNTGTTTSVAEVSQDVPNKGYQCLESKVGSQSKLSFEQAIFAGLALGKGKDDKIFNTIKENKKSSEACWPAGGCKLKETAQVALYYKRIGENTDEIVKWLGSKNATATGLTWYLEIDILDHTAAECSVGFDDVKKTIQIQEDMKLGSGAATACFAPSTSGYWLQLADRCVEKSFEISCTKDFLTTLLYEKSVGRTIYVSPETHNAAQGAKTTEKIEAKCFKTGSGCDYEGTLWTAMVLHSLDIDASSYVPYLQALEEDNLNYFSSAFLYFIQPSQEQYSKIIEQKKPGNFWEIIGSSYKRYYDTGLAILALDRSSSVRTEVEQAKSYLATAQLKDGCWNARDAIIDTGFVLYSAWPRAIKTGTGGPGTTAFCSELKGASCETDKTACTAAGGRELTIYTCLRAKEFCCSVKVPAKTCLDQQGTLCKTNEDCLAQVLDASDSGVCCSTQCAIRQNPNTCPLTAECKTACGTDEEEKSGVSCGDGRACCAAKSPGEEGNSTWIIILIILILIVIIAIIFRKKIQMAWYNWRGNVKSVPVTRPGSSGAAPATMQGFGPRPPFSPGVARPMMRALPIRPAARQSSSLKDKELEATMKKLRDMTR